MKRKSVILALILFSSLWILEAKGRIGFFLTGGPALLDLSFSVSPMMHTQHESMLRLTGSLGLEFALKTRPGKISVSTGLSLLPLGDKKSFEVSGASVEVTNSGYLLTLPLLAKYYFLSSSSPYLLVGGEIGYVLSMKENLKAAGEELEIDLLDFDTTNRFYYGLVFGAGVEKRFSSFSLLWEFCYHLAISNLIKAQPGESAKPRALVLQMGIKF